MLADRSGSGGHVHMASVREFAAEEDGEACVHSQMPVWTRRMARVLGLPCADKPAAPCLASRIPHHHEVSPEKLAQVEAAEGALRRLGFADCRGRHHGDVARVELCRDDLMRAVVEPLRTHIHRAASTAGFRFVAVDLVGIQTGAFTLPLVTRVVADDAVHSPNSTSIGRGVAAIPRLCSVGKTPAQVEAVAATVRAHPARTFWIDVLRAARVIVVVPRMDGALPAVVTGLVSAPIVAVPTSTGYGAAFGGIAALLTMLNSCAPSAAVVNIDNGYRAGHLAAQIAAPS